MNVMQMRCGVNANGVREQVCSPRVESEGLVRGTVARDNKKKAREVLLRPDFHFRAIRMLVERYPSLHRYSAKNNNI